MVEFKLLVDCEESFTDLRVDCVESFTGVVKIKSITGPSQVHAQSCASSTYVFVKSGVLYIKDMDRDDKFVPVCDKILFSTGDVIRVADYKSLYARAQEIIHYMNTDSYSSNFVFNDVRREEITIPESDFRTQIYYKMRSHSVSVKTLNGLEFPRVMHNNLFILGFDTQAVIPSVFKLDDLGDYINVSGDALYVYAANKPIEIIMVGSDLNYSDLVRIRPSVQRALSAMQKLHTKLGMYGPHYISNARSAR